MSGYFNICYRKGFLSFTSYTFPLCKVGIHFHPRLTFGYHNMIRIVYIYSCRTLLDTLLTHLCSTMYYSLSQSVVLSRCCPCVWRISPILSDYCPCISAWRGTLLPLAIIILDCGYSIALDIAYNPIVYDLEIPLDATVTKISDNPIK